MGLPSQGAPAEPAGRKDCGLGGCGPLGARRGLVWEEAGGLGFPVRFEVKTAPTRGTQRTPNGGIDSGDSASLWSPGGCPSVPGGAFRAGLLSCPGPPRPERAHLICLKVK